MKNTKLVKKKQKEIAFIIKFQPIIIHYNVNNKSEINDLINQIFKNKFSNINFEGQPFFP